MSIKRDINDIKTAIANPVDSAVVDGLVVKVDKILLTLLKSKATLLQKQITKQI